jgi:hypothetical protein
MKGSEKGMREAAEITLDPVLDEALGNFRQSVHAWSEAAYRRHRTAAAAVARHGWRMTGAWALACGLAAASLWGGLYEHHQQVTARIRAAQQVKQRQLAIQNTRKADEDLLATVDSDISRAVPTAFEPLAQLMDNSGNN